MLARLFLRLAQGSGETRRRLFRALFEFIARRSLDKDHWTQMNYGFADTDGSGHTIHLAAAFESERFCHQLYERVTRPGALCGKDVAEVSSGRGGGAAFIARTFAPETMTGIDIAPTAVEFSRRVHDGRNLRFIQGDAENLPLFDESLDAIVNIEASFCYGSFDRFLAEIIRVLRPGGQFLFADLRFDDEIPALLAAFRRSGLQCLEQEDISDNVLRALELDAARREAEIRRCAPWYARAAMRTFGGAQDTRIPRLLAAGRMRYLRFAFRKPEFPTAEIQPFPLAVAYSANRSRQAASAPETRPAPS